MLKLAPEQARHKNASNRAAAMFPDNGCCSGNTQVTEPHRLHVERRAAIAAGLAPPPYTSSSGGGEGGRALSPGSSQPNTPRQRDLSTDSPARSSLHAAFAKTPPGKLDHATVVAYQVSMCTRKGAVTSQCSIAADHPMVWGLQPLPWL